MLQLTFGVVLGYKTLSLQGTNVLILIIKNSMQNYPSRVGAEQRNILTEKHE